MANAIDSFAQFWPFYVRQHQRRGTRAWHFVGTGAFIVGAVVGGATHSPAYPGAGVVAAYGLAWMSHAFIEHNRPATFTYPFWSLFADFKMFAMTLLGRMDAEVQRHCTKDLA